MNASQLKKEIQSLIKAIVFVYNGKDCGVDPFSANNIDVWYGDKAETMTSIDDVMNSKFFDGKSLAEISSSVSFS